MNVKNIKDTHSSIGNIEAACIGMPQTVVRPYIGVKPVGYPIFS